jgi:hypothetical protein
MDVSDHYIMDSEGNVQKATLMEWARWIDDGRNKIVRQETVGGKWVSTVFLGLDHRFTGKGPPILFETMVFPNKKDLHEERCERYCTRAAAITGHESIVAELTKDTQP